VAFSRVEDNKGNVILSSTENQDVHRVYTQATAFMLVDALTTAVQSGTGTAAQIDGMTVAGKTGTVANEKGVLFAGITPYYSSVVWIGHDYFKELKNTSGGKAAAPLWQQYMAKILEGKEDKPIIPGSALENGCVTLDVCPVSGLLATEACALDAGGRKIVSDYFPQGGGPIEQCTWHSQTGLCTVSSMLAGDHCPPEALGEGSVIVLPETSDYWLLPEKDLLTIFPNLQQNGETCTVHTAEWADEQILLNMALEEAQDAMAEKKAFVTDYESRITAADMDAINDAASQLKKAMDAEVPSSDQINEKTDHLRQVLREARNNLMPEIIQPEDPGEGEAEGEGGE